MASTQISRSISSAGSTTIATLSCWIKRANLDAEGFLFYNIENGNNNCRVRFNTDNKLEVEGLQGGSQAYTLRTVRQFRDPAAWYHLVVRYDSTDSTADNRIRIYVNGTEETSLENRNNPSSSGNMSFNEAGTVYVGGQAGSNYFGGCIAHYHWVDGTAYTPTTFGETDSTSGIWVPKTNPTVTYGTNGFFLKFENSGNLDLDSSGNNQSFTTAGTLTQNIDTPSNNFPTLNRIAPSQANRTGGNGNLYTGGNSDNYWSSHPTTMACKSGKWYFEIKDETDWGSTSDSTRRYGIANLASASLSQGVAGVTDVLFSNGDYAYAYMNSSGVRYNGSTISGTTSTHPTFAEGDFIMVAMDLDNLKLYFGKNGTWLDSGDPTSGASGTGAVATLAAEGTWAPYLEVKYGSDTASINLGQGYFRTAVAGTNADANGHGKFKYSVPSGYYAICTKNIKEFG